MEKVYPVGLSRKEMIKNFSAVVVMLGILLFPAFISETLLRTAPNC
jgi:preprotein translocase subunit SecE